MAQQRLFASPAAAAPAVELEKRVVERFDEARSGGASERTAIRLAAWLWLDLQPDDDVVGAGRRVKGILRQRGRRLKT